jgi:hypothetical protein
MEVNLGAIRFNWKGAYAGATAYVADDVVSSGGASYICILASTGNAVSNATYWSIMSSAGTNGTDIGTTITTQGDLLFRDASGLQRLAKGTAAQVLAMNAGATAPEWQAAAAGGAWTLINSTVASNTASITITGIDTTYDNYVVSISGLIPVTDNGYLQFRMGDSAGIKTANYAYHIQRAGSNAAQVQTSISSSDSHIPLSAGTGNVSSEGGSYMIFLYGPATAAGLSRISVQGSYINDGGTLTSVSGTGYQNTAYGVMHLSQIQVYYGNGSMSSGRVSLYGIKHT